MVNYKDYAAVTVQHGKRDVWGYVTCFNGCKLHQYLTPEKAENVLVGLRATTWKETHIARDNKEIWKFEA
jgi:hypothetical protein